MSEGNKGLILNYEREKFLFVVLKFKKIYILGSVRAQSAVAIIIENFCASFSTEILNPLTFNFRGTFSFQDEKKFPSLINVLEKKSFFFF